MKCLKHNKDVEGVCTWCGKELCKMCISKTDGRKKYCSSCVNEIGDLIKKKQIDKIREEEAQEKQAPSAGYFSFDSLKGK
ncbi:hypothetical protein KY308_02585 [Candidatus Woesearchaeota archaeon]|nr:hypothetical protein [Candidatus Woesearchaeota archaeon]